MAWSLSHTMPGGGSLNITAQEYLFDTILAGMPGHTISAHPSGGTRRLWKREVTTSVVTNAVFPEYMWVIIYDDELRVYADKTYTTVPGDKGSDSASFISSNIDAFDSFDWKFWTSDLNPNAVLVTRGKYMVFADVAAPLGYHVEDGVWDGSRSARTCVFPLLAAQYWYQPTCKPWTISAGNTSEGAMVQAMYPGGKLSVNDDYVVAWGVGTLAAGSNNNPASSVSPIYAYMQEDVGQFHLASAGPRYTTSSSSAGSLILDTTSNKYLFQPSVATSGSALVFDMGSTEPDMS